jgi:mRNA interferase HicA
VTSNELRRWLAGKGCTFQEGTKHTKVFCKTKVTILPRHGAKELPIGTVEAIKKQLGLK